VKRHEHSPSEKGTMTVRFNDTKEHVIETVAEALPQCQSHPDVLAAEPNCLRQNAMAAADILTVVAAGTFS
jgi:hypothetical protein